MWLVIDIGNTDIVFGFNSNGAWPKILRVPDAQFEEAGERLRKYMAKVDIHVSDVEHVVMSSVVPNLTPAVFEIVENVMGAPPMLVVPTSYQGLGLDIDHPEEIGTDLVANAVAAWNQFRDYCIIVDFGTALTFTVVSDKPKVLGVSIAPGLRTAMNALFHKAAKLPEVPLELPRSAIGKNTNHALQAGTLLGYVGLVSYMLDRIQAELPKPAHIVATGGLSYLLEPLHPRFEQIDPLLTLEGIRLIGENML